MKTVSASIAVDTALHEWRRKATNVFLAASAFGFLPGVLLQLLIQDRSYPRPILDFVFLNYIILILCAIVYKGDYRVRMWITIVFGQLLSLISGAAAMDSPFLRILPIPQSLMAMVLVGRRSGRAIAVSSSIVMLASPFIVLIPGVPSLLQIPPGLCKPAAVLVREGSVLTAALVCLMVLLSYYHNFLIQSLTSEHRAAADLKREVEHNKTLERELARIGDDERRRLGQDVHDGVCQQLTGALLRCQALERRIERGDHLSKEDLNALSLLLEDGIDEAHAVAKGLCPLDSEPGALPPALNTMVKRIQLASSISCELKIDGDTRIPDISVAQQLYRIAQEALSNSVRHSGASQISVRLSGTDNEIHLVIQDNGSGLPEDMPKDRMGLRTMNFRAQMVDGCLQVDSLDSGGTRVSCHVPRIPKCGGAT